MSQRVESLVEPLSAHAPCGVSLEDTQLLNGFDAYRLFGSNTRLAADINWRELRDQSYEALEKSRDLRLLAHLAAAVSRTDGLDALCSVLCVAESWLKNHWIAVFPGIEEDTVIRKNALMSFADRMAIVDAVRRAPIVVHRQLGSYSLRHLELATGQLAPTESDTDVPTRAQIDAALEGTPVEELQSRSQCIAAGMSAVRNITTIMQTQGGFESAPDFEPLLAPLLRIDRLLKEHLATRSGVVAPSHEDTQAPMPSGAEPTSIGSIRSRQDAIRAIDAAATFFRKNEPSSPIPLLLDRAKRLVSKSFLEVLEDIAPESLTQARAVGGIRPDEG
jgi:type VI secretion system protein ImpA